MIGFVHRLKQFIQKTAVRNHGSAGIHQKKKLHGILTGLIHDNLQATAIVTGLPDSPVQVQFCFRNIQFGGKLTKLSKCHLELSSR